MIKILDAYISKKFFSKFLFIIIGFISIFTVVDIIDKIDKFIEKDISNSEMITYYFLTIPWYISLALPMTLLISTIFCFSILQKNQELTALKASGVSIMRISYPIIIFGIFFSIFSFYFDNIIVVNSLQKRAVIEKKLNPKNITISKKNNIYYHLDNSFLSIKYFNYKINLANNISIQKYEGADLKERLDAKKMKWQENINAWALTDIEIRSWENNTYSYSYTKDSIIIIEDISPSIIKKDFLKPEDMNYWELTSFIKKLENKGLSYNRWLVNKHFKTAFACSPLIMILFGIALSIQKPKSNFTLGFGLSIIVIFLYYLLIKAGQSLGYNNILPPFLSIWLVNFLFLVFGSYLFIKSRT